MDYSEHIYARRPRNNRKPKTLAELLKARNALNAKIAAIKKAELAKAIKVGVVVTVKDHVNDIKGNWVENRHTDCHYTTHGHLEFKVTKVNKAEGTITIRNSIAGTHTVRLNDIKAKK